MMMMMMMIAFLDFMSRCVPNCIYSCCLFCSSFLIKIVCTFDKVDKAASLIRWLLHNNSIGTTYDLMVTGAMGIPGTDSDVIG